MSNTDIIAQNMRPIKQVGEHIGDVLVVSNIADEITTVSTDRNAILAVYHNLATVSTSEKYAEESKAAADKSREYARLAMAVAQGGSGTWLEGPPGIQGEKGDQGEPGQKGDQGETGSKGATGDRGPQGLQGVPGVAGSLGAQGLQGVPGVQGLQGLPGLQGNTGPAGENAAAAINPRGDFQVNATPLYAKNDYITASNGNSYVCKLGMTEANIAPTTGDSTDPHWQILALAGAQGLQGIQGEIGAKGDKGDKGETGEKGDKGETGAQGFDGTQGAAGATGAQGLQGMQGEQGLKGDKGEAGAGIPLGGAVGQVIIKKSSNDLDVMWGDVSGEGGTSSGTTDHSALTNRDKIDQHPISAVTGLQAVLDNLDSKPNTWEDLQGKPTAFTPKLHALNHSAEGADPIAYTSLRGLPDLSLKQDKLPNFTDNAGKFLSTDGTSLSWETAGGGGSGDVVGSIKLWPLSAPEPPGYLFCNGGILDRTDYMDLFSILGHQYDTTNVDVDKFQLPDIKSMLVNNAHAWVDTGIGAGNWFGIAVNPTNGDVWTGNAGLKGVLKVSRGGTGSWVDVGADTRAWFDITVNPTNGDVWVSNNKIKVLRGGTGSWIDTSADAGVWYSIAVNPTNGDVWACNNDGTVKVLRGGTGSWVDTGASAGGWRCVAVNPTSGDVWAGTDGGGIKVLRGGMGSWIDAGAGAGKWKKLAVNPANGDVWAGTSGGTGINGTVKVLRGGMGSWVDAGAGAGSWYGIAVNHNNGDVWACTAGINGTVKVLRGGMGSWVDSGAGTSTHAAGWQSVAVNLTNGDVWAGAFAASGVLNFLQGTYVAHIIKANK